MLAVAKSNIRQRLPHITFFAPGSKHYDNGLFANTVDSFVNISITGTSCQCNCEHCNGKMLTGMLPVSTPQGLIELATTLMAKGCKGVLISGGACCDGSVPLGGFGEALSEIRQMGLAVVVHPGLITAELAKVLAKAKVSRVALDLIGDQATIQQVYHLSKTPEDYHRSLQITRAAGLKVSPHIVVGLHFGSIRGEYAALNMVAKEGADSLVLVILKPLDGTNMAQIKPPAEGEVIKLFQTARKLLPDMPIALGCARPVGQYARRIEQAAVEIGFDAIAYPARETVDFAMARGLEIEYHQVCCGMLTDF